MDNIKALDYGMRYAHPLYIIVVKGYTDSEHHDIYFIKNIYFNLITNCKNIHCLILVVYNAYFLIGLIVCLFINNIS